MTFLILFVDFFQQSVRGFFSALPLESHYQLTTRFFYKEHLYKEIEVEKGSKNKEFLRN